MQQKFQQEVKIAAEQKDYITAGNIQQYINILPKLSCNEELECNYPHWRKK